MTSPFVHCHLCGDDMPDYDVHHHFRLLHPDVDIAAPVIEFESRFAQVWRAITRGAA